VDTYLAPNKTFPSLRDMLNDGSIDLLRIQRCLPRGIQYANSGA
jgi:hypothetical protein